MNVSEEVPESGEEVPSVLVRLETIEKAHAVLEASFLQVFSWMQGARERLNKLESKGQNSSN